MVLCHKDVVGTRAANVLQGVVMVLLHFLSAKGWPQRVPIRRDPTNGRMDRGFPGTYPHNTWMPKTSCTDCSPPPPLTLTFRQLSPLLPITPHSPTFLPPPPPFSFPQFFLGNVVGKLIIGQVRKFWCFKRPPFSLASLGHVTPFNRLPSEEARTNTQAHVASEFTMVASPKGNQPLPDCRKRWHQCVPHPV